MMDHVLGRPVIVVRPTSKEIARTWRERLWSLPWRPWVRTRLVVIPAAIGPSQIFEMNGAFYMGEAAFAALRKAEAPHAG
jgi:hypothetical protein